MDLPKRKPNRLKKYDYGKTGAYLITVCAKDRKNLFWNNVGAGVIQQMKGYVTKQIGFTVWQKLFYDHIIRNENDYREIWEYIENNPIKLTEDRFYNK